MKIIINNEKINPDAIFLDLDGTLIDDRKNLISKENLDAINEQSKFSNIFISTGRNFGQTVKAIFDMTNIQYAICQNGALIYDRNGKKILNIPLKTKYVEKLISFAKKHNLVVLVNSEKKLYSKRIALKIAKIFNSKMFFSFDKFNYDQEITKVVFSGTSRKKIHKFYKLIKEEFPYLSHSISAKDWIIEITDIKANKGIAAKFLCDKLSLDRNKSIHIGDSLNDSPTINYLSILIAMENSSKELKELATYIGPKNKNGGIAKIFKKTYTAKNII